MSDYAEMLDESCKDILRRVPSPRALSCQSIWGHRFEARYNLKGPPNAEAIEAMVDDVTPEVILALGSKTYCGDVCVRCGQVVNKP